MLKAEGLFCTHKKFELQRLTMRASTQRQEKCTEGAFIFFVKTTWNAKRGKGKIPPGR